MNGNLEQAIRKTTNVEEMIVAMKNRSNSTLMEKIRSSSKLASKYQMCEDASRSVSNLDVKVITS